jgi:hypothetical protein
MQPIASINTDNNSEYIGRSFLLSNKDRNSLFTTGEGYYVEFEFDQTGNIFANEISESLARMGLDLSLERLCTEYLKIEDLSAEQLLEYLVLPEMEVERIFNSLRYNYLRAICISDLENPYNYLSSSCNKAFQALAGIKVYQGRVKERKENDYFWKSAGFKDANRSKFVSEQSNLKFIIDYIRNLKIDNFNRIYAELIAIKPGFHEIQMHEDYFQDGAIPKGRNLRDQVFRSLRGIGDLNDIKLASLPREINCNSYFSYAPCNVTEGPFVFRKRISISYFDEISRMRSEEDKKTFKFEDKFFICDYKKRDIGNRSELEAFLKKARIFNNFMCLKNS